MSLRDEIKRFEEMSEPNLVWSLLLLADDAEFHTKDERSALIHAVLKRLGH